MKPCRVVAESRSTVESLESRTLCAGQPASAALDPNYLFAQSAIRKLVGDNARVFQAVAAPGDRTYLLAERYADRSIPNGGGTGFLTIIAVTADGKLDTTFGQGGAILSGRVTQKHYAFESSGILKLDNVGRLYFADDVRVMRFRPNGTPDATFGTRGVATFASSDQAVALCDIAPVDDGVLIATTKTAKGVQRYAVQKVDRRVHTVFESAHAQKRATVDIGGQINEGFQSLRHDYAQFATSRGGVVLGRVETDYVRYPYSNADTDPGSTAIGAERQTLVVTSFNSAYRGTDVSSVVMQAPPDQYSETSLGSMRLSANGRVLLAETGPEIIQYGHQLLRFNVVSGTVKRISSPVAYDPDQVGTFYQLLPDGDLGIFVRKLDSKNRSSTAISKYIFGGGLDTTFASGGTANVTGTDYSGGGNSKILQIFLGTSGRLYFLATGNITPANTLTLRRV